MEVIIIKEGVIINKLKKKGILSLIFITLIFQSVVVNAKNINNDNRIVTKKTLPYTYCTENNVRIKINTFSVSTKKVVINITIYNNALTFDKGDTEISSYNLSDGKNILKVLSKDNQFDENNPLSYGESVTGNIIFQGIKNKKTKFFTLNGAFNSVNCCVENFYSIKFKK